MSGAHTPMVVIAARVLCRRSAELCVVDYEDLWKQYGEDYLQDAQAMLDAIGATELLDALHILTLACLLDNQNENLGPHVDWRILDAANAAIAKATGSES